MPLVAIGLQGPAKSTLGRWYRVYFAGIDFDRGAQGACQRFETRFDDMVGIITIEVVDM